MKWIVAGGCFLLTLFCIYGFIASGELHGSEALMWKGGYATLGVASLIGAIFLAAGGTRKSHSESDEKTVL